jgi:hypothetical protein
MPERGAARADVAVRSAAAGSTRLPTLPVRASGAYQVHGHPWQSGNDASGIASVKNVDIKLEVVVIPVSDVDRAKGLLRKPAPACPDAGLNGGRASVRSARVMAGALLSGLGPHPL